MSTESSSSVDAEYVQATKQQVRNMVAEIAQLSKSDADPADFYEALLSRAVSALVATGGAIWAMDEQGQLQLQYQINLQGTGVANSEEGQTQHYRLLNKALNEPDGMLVAPQSGTEGDEEAANPTDWLLILGRLASDREARGVIEIFQRPGAGPVTQRGYLRFLLQLCDLAGNYLASQQLRNFEDRQTLWGQLERFTKSVHDSLDPVRTAYTVVNEGRRLIECDRVSLAIQRGRKCQVEAISHQDMIDRRSNVSVLLSRLATRVVATGDPLWYSGNTEDMAPQVEEAVHEYVDESHAKVVGVLPLFKPDDSPEDAETDHDKPVVVVEALIVEQFDQSTLKERMLQRVDVVKDHASSAIANSMEHNSIFLMPLWRTLGKLRWIVGARTLPKTVGIAIAILAAILALVFVPADFEIEARGHLQPADREDVFVKQGGLIKTVEPHVDHGVAVAKGQKLLQMTSPDLDGEITNLEGLIQETSAQLSWISTSMSSNSGNLPEDKRHQLRGQRMQLEKTKNSYQEQLKVLNLKREQLIVTSPMDGIIVTWDVKRRLAGRTVGPGQVVMSIADPSGEWELELYIPDAHMGYVLERQKELAKQAGEGGTPEPLSVAYILATDPETELRGTIKVVEVSAHVREEHGNVVVVLVKLEDDSFDPKTLRIGTSVTAKLDCGRRSIGFVLFHDMIAWIQTKILFRL